jgi:DNA polymerase-3 subunit beta
MKLSVSREELLEKLSGIQNIVEKRNTMPALSHFLLDANKKMSYILATDLETAIKEPINLKLEKEGRLCIPARKLFEIVKEVEGEITMESQQDSQWLLVSTGKSNFKLACLAADEFPAWPSMENIEEIQVETKSLAEMIEKSIYAAGESDTRYTLNGILFHALKSGEVTVVGTDGHRLACISKKISTQLKEEKKVIVPRKAAAEVIKFLDRDTDQITIVIGKSHVMFKIDNIELLTRLIEGTYPNYEQVIPSANENKIKINKGEFSKALRRVSVMSKEKSNAVKVDIGKELLTVSASNPDLGEAKDEMKVEYKGEPVSLGFNAKYLLDALNSMTGENVVFELNDPLSPTLLKEEGSDAYKCVIMPMRI